MKAIAYCRVSTDKQAEHGLGLDVQRAAITAWAEANGCTITAWRTDEGISGSNGLDTRPGLAEAFRQLEAGEADALVVYRLDRLARKLGSQITWIEQLESRGRHVISVTEPDVGQDEMRVFVRQVLGAVAEYERATIVRRMKDGRALKAERGGFAYGEPAYGQRAQDRELAADSAEVQVITRMRQMQAEGLSLRAIARALNDEAVPPKRGGAWHAQTVARVLAR
jgi:DNA invertase Pin-like site-specific DNA recombinase